MTPNQEGILNHLTQATMFLNNVRNDIDDNALTTARDNIKTAQLYIHSALRDALEDLIAEQRQPSTD